MQGDGIISRRLSETAGAPERKGRGEGRFGTHSSPQGWELVRFAVIASLQNDHRELDVGQLCPFSDEEATQESYSSAAC